MEIKSIDLIYFSSTHATERIVKTIAEGIHAQIRGTYDLTPPRASEKPPRASHCNLAIIGSPVYAGRLPETMVSRFRIKGSSTPAILVAVYGNRAYEDALRELNDLAILAGFIPVALSAFPAEHSFSTRELPIAAGRPDLQDLVKAKMFGERVLEIISSLDAPHDMLLPTPPGNFPYKDARIFSGITPSVDEKSCTTCLTCVSVCPTAAIPQDNPLTTDPNLCIRCSACIKACPEGARRMDHPKMRQIAEFLHKNCNDRKEPEFYVGSIADPKIEKTR
ncbi:MAG: 4Fe-4S binding protein [Syntrophales bacterium]|jgi:ferredoxin|nr:4Fe-4S binding protein [Syntrophales bacterium]